MAEAPYDLGQDPAGGALPPSLQGVSSTDLNWVPQTGTLKPLPPDRDAAIAEATTAVRAQSRLSTAYDAYINEHGGPSVWKVSSGNVMRLVEQEPDERGNPVAAKWVVDDAATRLYESKIKVQDDLDAYEKMFKKGGPFYAVAASTGSGGGGSGGGGMAPGEAEREAFLGFMEYAKGLYGLENEEQAWSMRADDQNTANYKAVTSGDMPFYAANFYPGQRPMNNRLSDVLRPAVPDYVPAPYGSSGSFGFGQGLPLPGEDPMGGGGWGFDSMPGYAEGTPGESGIDPEIAWMVGLNPYGKHPGSPFDPNTPYGQSLRGIPDRRVA